MIFRFTINFGYWRHIYLDLISQFKVTNLRAFKITFENPSYTQHEKRYFPKVRILGSNPFLT
jgi:hypothetical protein